MREKGYIMKKIVKSIKALEKAFNGLFKKAAAAEACGRYAEGSSLRRKAKEVGLVMARLKRIAASEELAALIAEGREKAKKGREAAEYKAALGITAAREAREAAEARKQAEADATAEAEAWDEYRARKADEKARSREAAKADEKAHRRIRGDRKNRRTLRTIRLTRKGNAPKGNAPKNGTVTPNVSQAVKEAKAGKAEAAKAVKAAKAARIAAVVKAAVEAKKATEAFENLHGRITAAEYKAAANKAAETEAAIKTADRAGRAAIKAAKAAYEAAKAVLKAAYKATEPKPFKIGLQFFAAPQQYEEKKQKAIQAAHPEWPEGMAKTIAKAMSIAAPSTTVEFQAPEKDSSEFSEKKADFFEAIEEIRQSRAAATKALREAHRESAGIQVRGFIPEPKYNGFTGCLRGNFRRMLAILAGIRNREEAAEALRTLAKTAQYESVREMLTDARRAFSPDCFEILKAVYYLAAGSNIPEELESRVSEFFTEVKYLGWKTETGSWKSLLGVAENREDWETLKAKMADNPELEEALACSIISKIDVEHFDTIEEAEKAITVLKRELRDKQGEVAQLLNKKSNLTSAMRKAISPKAREALKKEISQLDEVIFAVVGLSYKRLRNAQAERERLTSEIIEPRNKVKFQDMDIDLIKVYPWESPKINVQQRVKFFNALLDKKLPSGRTLREVIAEIQNEEFVDYSDEPELQVEHEYNRAKEAKAEAEKSDDVFYYVNGRSRDLYEVWSIDHAGETSLVVDRMAYVPSSEEECTRNVYNLLNLMRTHMIHIRNTQHVIANDWVEIGGNRSTTPSLYDISILTQGRKALQVTSRLKECEAFAARSIGEGKKISRYEYDKLIAGIDITAHGWPEKEIKILLTNYGREGEKAFNRLPNRETKELRKKVSELGLKVVDPCKWVYNPKDQLGSIKALKWAAIATAEALGGCGNKSEWTRRVIAAAKGINDTVLEMAVENGCFMWQPDPNKEEFLDTIALALKSKESKVSKDLLMDLLFAEGSIAKERQRFIDRAKAKDPDVDIESISAQFDYVGFGGGSALEADAFRHAYKPGYGSQSRFRHNDEISFEEIIEEGNLLETEDESELGDLYDSSAAIFSYESAIEMTYERALEGITPLNEKFMNALEATKAWIKAYEAELELLKEEVKALREKGEYKALQKQGYSIRAQKLLRRVPESIQDTPSSTCPKLEGLLEIYREAAGRNWSFPDLRVADALEVKPEKGAPDIENIEELDDEFSLEVLKDLDIFDVE